MTITRPRVSVLLAPIVLAVCGCTLDGRGHGQPVTYDGGQVTVDGCLGPGGDGKLLLWIVNVSDGAAGDEESNGGPAAARIGQSTSLDGPWVGTRELELVPNPSEDVAQYHGRVLRVIGVIEPERGTTGLTDQMKSVQGVRFARLHVMSIQPAQGKCVIQGSGGAESQTSARRE